jgi:hypothetical protein
MYAVIMTQDPSAAALRPHRPAWTPVLKQTALV